MEKRSGREDGVPMDMRRAGEYSRASVTILLRCSVLVRKFQATTSRSEYSGMSGAIVEHWVFDRARSSPAFAKPRLPVRAWAPVSRESLIVPRSVAI